MSKVVLITGASNGLGKALGERLHHRGYRVYGTSRHPGRYESPFPLLSMDVTDEAAVRRAVQEVVDREGALDVVINNAGVGMAAPLENASLDSVRQLFDTNVFGLVRVCQAALPHLRKAGGGAIINISSIAGTVGLPYRSFYCASKAAVDMLGEALRLETAPFGTRVATVLAGDMRTSIRRHWVGDYDPAGDAVYGESYRRVVSAIENEVDQGLAPEEVARDIEKILEAAHPNKTYVLGKPLQKASVAAKRLLPARLFERIIKSYSKL